MARYKWIMQNIRAVSYNGTIAVHWETDEARFHIYLDGETPRDTIYKNPLVERGRDYPPPAGYFETRKLNPANRANYWIIEEIMRAVRDGDMINKAKAEYEAKQAAERAAQDQRIARIKHAKRVFENMRSHINSLSPYLMLTTEDMLALLEYEPTALNMGE